MSSAKSVEIGETLFGAGAPVRVESMLKTPLSDVDGCLHELDALKEAGCELVRIAFPEMNLAPALSFDGFVMNILISNDDGISARGLRELVDAKIGRAHV